MKKNAGFSLIELMIVVAIIGVLAALAYPAYMNSILKSNRSEAKAWLNDVSQRMQRCYTAFGRFDDPSTTNQCGVLVDLQDGNGIDSRDRGFYNITVDRLTQTTFTLTAKAVLAPQTNDTGCDTLTLDSKGQKSPIDCW